MRHLGPAALAIAALLAGCADDPLQPPPGPGAAPWAASTGAVDTGLQTYLVGFRAAAPPHFESVVAALGGTVLLNHRIGLAMVDGLDGDAAAALKKAVGAMYVDPAPVFELARPAAVSSLAPMSELPAAVVPASPANPAGALGFGLQWNMRQIRANAAWAAGRLGDPGVTVAILDTGIDYLLPDLAGRVDLSRSASFEPRDDSLVATYFPTLHPSTDLHFHGTNVASQVASNAIVFAGVTSQATLLSVKVCSVYGGCHGLLQGILHAIDNGADVINMSLGGYLTKAAAPGAVSAFNTVLNYARQRGVTVVVAAGNEANDLDRHRNIAVFDEDGSIGDRVHVPSLFAVFCDAVHVICVSASSDADAPASYSNFGRSAIDVAAPGGDFTDAGAFWVYSLCPRTSLVLNCGGGLFVIGVAGTSQAAPHVAGLAALAIEDVGRNPAEVRAYIRDSADPIGGGNTAFYGKGRINVARAVGLN